MDPIAELAWIVEPFDIDIISSALAGRSTCFDRDAGWSAHHRGQPRTVPRGIDAMCEAMVAGAQAIAYLAAVTPVDDSRRASARDLYCRIRQRLHNPELLLFASFEDSSDAVKARGGKPYDLPGASSWQPAYGYDNGALVASG